MSLPERYLLTVNAGSSSIKFALFTADNAPTHLSYGQIENIETKNTRLQFTDLAKNNLTTENIEEGPYSNSIRFLIDWLHDKYDFGCIVAIGHRVVYGMEHEIPVRIDSILLAELKAIVNYDPEHMPSAIQLIEEFGTRFPKIPQVACFDTSFHKSMPEVAKTLAIPRRYREKGIRRYGFHGLSYSYLLEELTQLMGTEKPQGRVIMAHLGNGASLAAINDGRCMDTSMGFSPAAGLPMSKRSGDIDPGIVWYLMKSERLDAEGFTHMMNYESGLLGLSEISSDMRELRNLQYTDSRAREAVDFFCYQTRKWIGSFTAVLGGLDTLVFAGGIGENAPEIRSSICSGLQFFGIELDESMNVGNQPVISSAQSTVSVRVMKTNEELMIARLTYQTLHLSIN